MQKALQAGLAVSSHQVAGQAPPWTGGLQCHPHGCEGRQEILLLQQGSVELPVGCRDGWWLRHLQDASQLYIEGRVV